MLLSCDGAGLAGAGGGQCGEGVRRLGCRQEEMSPRPDTGVDGRVGVGRVRGWGGRWQRGDLLLFFYCFVVVARRFYNI